MNKILFSASFLLFFTFCQAQKKETVKFIPITELQKANSQKPKKVMVDVYTDWCGWCKKMDKSTFTDPVIAKMLEEKFHAVKFNAESSEEITFKNAVFKNPNPGKSRSPHQLAMTLMNNNASYPTLVFLDEDLNLITPVPGYMEPKDLEPILEFIGGDHYKTQKWEDFHKNFKGKCK